VKFAPGRVVQSDLRAAVQSALRQCVELRANAAAAAQSALAGLTQFSVARRRDAVEPPHPSSPVEETAAEEFAELASQFPAIRTLWKRLIDQSWLTTLEILQRAEADRAAISHAFFGGKAIGSILKIEKGLSDPHHAGRTVARLHFQAGAIIYKPRGGEGEAEWFALLSSMNDGGYEPAFRTVTVLRRLGYFWMENVRREDCPSESAARRFHVAMGGLVCLAHLLQMVDCHCDNVIAAGEHPVLLDAETIWHVDRAAERSSARRIFRTGFLPLPPGETDGNFPCSPLGQIEPGDHSVFLDGIAVDPRSYQKEVQKGFASTWRWWLDHSSRRSRLLGRLRSITHFKRRWIHRPTALYLAMRDASLRPEALVSEERRREVLERICGEPAALSLSVSRGEVDALLAMDIPCFSHAAHGNEHLPRTSGLESALRHIADALS
jgi:lantibiotic modifying enzyme